MVKGGAHFNGPGLRLGLRSPIQLRHEGQGISAEFSLSEGNGKSFQLYELDARAVTKLAEVTFLGEEKRRVIQ